MTVDTTLQVSVIFGLSFLLSDAGDIMGFSSVSAQSFLKISIFAFTKTVLEQRYLEMIAY